MKFKSAVFLLLLLTFGGLSPSYAETNDFTVSIVGLRQSSSLNNEFQKDGFPLVKCPMSAARPAPDMTEDKLSNCFFVVVQNRKDAVAKIIMLGSEWDMSLQFKITDASGKVYSVNRLPHPYTVDAPLLRTYLRDGMDIMAVDLTNQSSENGWQGQPEAPDSPELVRMTATFSYRTAAKKLVKVTSKPTDVYLTKF